MMQFNANYDDNCDDDDDDDVGHLLGVVGGCHCCLRIASDFFSRFLFYLVHIFYLLLED